jgi:hypothetical protein
MIAPLLFFFKNLTLSSFAIINTIDGQLDDMKLPKTIADLIAAQDKYDSKAFADNFSDDAVVYDEGKVHHGKKEIRQWNEMTNEKYKTKYEPLDVSTKNGKIILTVKVSGTFDGSPIILKYIFEVKEAKIISLRVINN